MPEQIYTFSEEEIAAMFKSGEMKVLSSPDESSPTEVLGTELIKEWEKQATKLADLFALELNQSKDQYIKGLPHFFPQPQNYKGRFEIPLIVQVPTRKLTLGKMLQIVGITNYLSLKNVKDWEQDPGKFKTPEVPYITWLHDGSRKKDRSVADVRKRLATDERGGTLLDGLALFIQNPDILRSHYLDLPGSQFVFNYTLDLRLWPDEGWPQLGCGFVYFDDVSSRWGSVVAGRNIGI